MKKTFILFFALLTVFVLNERNLAQTSTVKMNEIYSRATAVAPDLDWIELYNSGTAQVDISGYKIYDNGGQAGTKPKMTFLTGTILPAKGFFVVLTDVSVTIDPSGFGLSSSGEQVWLENASGTVIDNVTFPAMDVTQTYGRYPDGSATWKLLTPLTKGVSNSIILMNEIYSRGTSTTHPDPDWIELYNASSASVDISSYKIYDNGGQAGTKPKMTFTAGTSISAKGFYLVVTDISTTVNPAGFGLSSSGEEVWLEDGTGAVVDNVVFPAMSETQSYSRTTDGNPIWRLAGLTKGITNGTGTAVRDNGIIVTDFQLMQNYPNPFNPSTKIQFAIPSGGNVSLKIYDILGRQVATVINRYMNPGSYIVEYISNNLPSGIYIYKLECGSFSQSKKMILLK